MKKIIVFVFAFVVLSVAANAQAQVAIGIKGGLNFAKLDANSSLTANYKSRTGYNFGAFVLIKVSKIGIQPEVLFSQQGSKVTYPSSTQNFTSNFSYVNVPIMLKLYTVLGINLQVGPQFGFLTNSPVVKDPQGQTINGAYKKSDLSAALGLGWDLPFGLTIDARYNLGLTKIQASNNPDQTKNQVFQISLGYKLIKFGS
jgi:Outer membrane protein beta-barrel domain